MKKTTTMLVLGLALMLLVAGCTTSAERSQFDYVPYGGQGCGFCDVVDTSFDLTESADVEALELL